MFCLCTLLGQWPVAILVQFDSVVSPGSARSQTAKGKCRAPRTKAGGDGMQQQKGSGAVSDGSDAKDSTGGSSTGKGRGMATKGKPVGGFLRPSSLFAQLPSAWGTPRTTAPGSLLGVQLRFFSLRSCEASPEVRPGGLAPSPFPVFNGTPSHRRSVGIQRRTRSLGRRSALGGHSKATQGRVTEERQQPKDHLESRGPRSGH